MSKLQTNFDFYASQHTTKGCKITHMIGVPMIAVSPVVSLFNKRLGRQMFSIGWGLQLLGHYIFERNTPVFLEVKNPLTFISSVIFISQQWSNIISGQGLQNDIKVEATIEVT